MTRPRPTTRSTRPTIRRGTAATEFAVALPVMILMALATGDFGRAFHYREAVSNAARVGATAAASRGFTTFTRSAWEAEVRSAVVAELANLPDFDEADLDLDLTVVGDGADLFTAAVELNYPFRTAVAWPALPSNVDIRERVEMQRYR